MATYHYNILLIPEGEALHKLCFSLSEDFEFWDYNWWNKTLSFDVIEPLLRQNLPNTEWSKEYSDLHQFGNDETNDITVSLVDEEFIENFHVRIDLRKIDQNFIGLVMKIAAENECLLIDRQGNIFDR